MGRVNPIANFERTRILQHLLIVVVAAIHLLAMNLASAGPLYCIWLRGLRSPASEPRSGLGRAMAWLSLAAFVLGMATGGVMLLFSSSSGFLAAVGRFPDRAVWMAGWELLFTFVCLLVYAMSWRKLGGRPLLHAILPMLATTNLLYHFPPLMAVLGKVAVNPNWTSVEIIDRPAFLSLMFEDEVLSFSAHFFLASITVAAVALFMLHARYYSKGDGGQVEGKKVVSKAAVAALIASALQLPVGIWILVALPSQGRGMLMGGDLVTSLMFVASMGITFVFLQNLAVVAFGDIQPSTLRRTGLWLIVLVLLMTATLRATHATHADQSTAQQIGKAVEAGPPRLMRLL